MMYPGIAHLDPSSSSSAPSPAQGHPAPSQATIAAHLRVLLTRYEEIGREYKAQRMGHAQYEEAVGALVRETAAALANGTGSGWTVAETSHP